MKLIPLTQGKFAQVDDEDYEYLSQFKWQALKGVTTWYATRRITVAPKQRKTVWMHREITGAPDGIDVDHQDRNGLNEQKANLQFLTRSEHVRRRRITTSKKTSQYKGVSWYSKYQNWVAQIQVDRKGIRLGYFQTELEAARAYDAAAREYFGEHAALNFPVDPQEISAL